MYENTSKIAVNTTCRNKSNKKWLTSCLHCIILLSLNHLQKLRDIKIMQCKREVSKFLFEVFSTRSI